MQIDHDRWNRPPQVDPIEDQFYQIQYSPDLVERSPRSTVPSRHADQTFLDPPNGFAAALGDGLAWIAGSVALRMGVETLLAQSLTFWVPSILILSAPAIAAVFLSTLMPRLSWVLGYRLVLVMFGLLIGGRL